MYEQASFGCNIKVSFLEFLTGCYVVTAQVVVKQVQVPSTFSHPLSRADQIAARMARARLFNLTSSLTSTISQD